MKILATVLLFCASGGAFASGQQLSADLSSASQLVAEGSATVVYGSLSAIAASGSAVVASVEVVADASIVVLAGALDAGKASVRLSGRAAQGASVAVGTAVDVVAMSTGYMLVAAGKVLAFVPNEAGKALLHHSRVDGRLP
jgi:hypothetical protein